MRSYLLRHLVFAVCLLVPLAAQADDLHIKKTLSVNGNVVSTTDTSIKGARERSVTQNPGGTSVTLRQCDLKRTVTLNEQAQTYLVANDPQDDSAAAAAALMSGAPAETGGKVVISTTTTDTGERKTVWGYTARHLKTTVSQESSANACSQVHQKFEIDGWYADVAKEQAGCEHVIPVRQTEGCHDKVVTKHSGSGKLGYPISETIVMHNPDASTITMNITTSQISKQPMEAELFDVPAGYREVKTMAELNGVPAVPQQQAYTQPAAAGAQNYGQQVQNTNNPAASMLMAQQAAMAQAGMLGNGMNGMVGQQQTPGGAPIAAPQGLGPKAPGKIRIGVVSTQAQVGQGSNAGADYGTPIRNVIIQMMSGPAVEVAALDSQIPVQVTAEAQQKQCDYVLYSSVTVKHGGGGFGKFMKMAGPMASMVPMAGMAGGMGGAVAAQAAGAAASAAAQAAQQDAMRQLSGFNGQIKQKDDVTVGYQLFPTGQTTPRVSNSLQAKAKSDGEDVLSPLLTQTATAVLTEVSKK